MVLHQRIAPGKRSLYLQLQGHTEKNVPAFVDCTGENSPFGVHRTRLGNDGSIRGVLYKWFPD